MDTQKSLCSVCALTRSSEAPRCGWTSETRSRTRPMELRRERRARWCHPWKLEICRDQYSVSIMMCLYRSETELDFKSLPGDVTPSQKEIVEFLQARGRSQLVECDSHWWIFSDKTTNKHSVLGFRLLLLSIVSAAKFSELICYIIHVEQINLILVQRQYEIKSRYSRLI